MQQPQNTYIRPVPLQGSSAPPISLGQRAILEAKLLKQTTTAASTLPDGASNRGPRPPSFAQESLWFIDQFEPGSSLYNIPHVLRLTGKLDLGALQKALENIVNRHNSLRSLFVEVDGKPMQVLGNSSEFILPVTNLSLISRNQREEEARRMIDEESMRPFNLSEGPLIRVSVLKLAADQHILMLTMHHIISDLWSFQVFYRELSVAYVAFAGGKSLELPPVKMQFPEYAACQRQKLEGEFYQKHLEYWKLQLAGELPVLELPTDRPRSARLSFKGRRKKIEMPLSILNGAKEISRRNNTTLFVTLLAAFQTLLHRYSSQTDVIVGAPFSGRLQIESEEMIGMLINTLPIRTSFGKKLGFNQILERVKQSVFNALIHQEAPVEKLIDDLEIPRNGARNPLFQTVFQSVQNAAPALRLPELKIEPLDIELGTSKFELTVTLGESEAGLAGDIEYSTDLFDEPTIDRLALHFKTLLESIIANPCEQIERLNFLPVAERELVTKTWNQTVTKYPGNSTIPQLFEEQVAETPDAVALVFEGNKLTYRELNCRANQVAHHLQKCGVGPEVMVGFCVERSLEMVIGLLGILKAGGAYVTLDPGMPRERLAYMFEDTNAPVFVTTNKFRDLAVAGSRVVCVDETETFSQENESNPHNGVTAENLAYVIYTSGSTGKPKGVLVPHRGVVRLVKETNYLKFSAADIFLQFATISFDASTLELWGPLLNGGKLVIFSPNFDSLEQLGKTIRENGVTTLWLTAGLFHEMVDGHIADLKSVKQLLAGGDVLSAPHVTKALRELPNTTLINGYGPTENTTFTCCFSLPCDWSGGRSVPIGKPISNTQVYVVDEQVQPVPVGVPGELLIGGDGLARDYLNAPELTAQKFIADPFNANPEAKLYRTGDRVRWLPDGNIEFIGRFDTQVKIRGFRIELSEVESALAENEAVQQCVVLAREDNSKTRQLVGYVVLKPGTSKTCSELREFLGKKLPAYMVPSAFVMLDSLPLNASGKVDRRSLPDSVELFSSKNESVAPRNAFEEKIAGIWSEVLGVPLPGVEENFFELGGHSLLATRVISRVNSLFHCNLPLRVLFESPTIAGLAQVIAGNESTASQNHPLIRRVRRLREPKHQTISEETK